MSIELGDESYQDKQDKLAGAKENTVIYVYGAWLVVEEKGGLHLTARDTTVIVQASGTQPSVTKSKHTHTTHTCINLKVLASRACIHTSIRVYDGLL